MVVQSSSLVVVVVIFFSIVSTFPISSQVLFLVSYLFPLVICVSNLS